MTIPLDLVLCALAGFILGFLGGWVVSSGRARHAVALARAESGARASQELAAAMEARARLDATLQAERQSVADSSRQFEERVSELQARIFAQEKDIKAATVDLLALRGQRLLRATVARATCAPARGGTRAGSRSAGRSLWWAAS